MVGEFTELRLDYFPHINSSTFYRTSIDVQKGKPQIVKWSENALNKQKKKKKKMWQVEVEQNSAELQPATPSSPLQKHQQEGLDQAAAEQKQHQVELDQRGMP